MVDLSTMTETHVLSLSGGIAILAHPSTAFCFLYYLADA